MAGTESGRRHTRDDVARAALRILDDDGLPDLTMRRLAAALDVQPSALYWHFPNKQTLLAELADRIVARAVPDDSGRATGADAPIGAHTRAAAFALRDALLAYRDGAEVVSSTLALGLGAAAARERLADGIAADGFTPAVSDRAATTLLHFVMGQVSYEQQRLQYDSFGVVAPDAAASPLAASGGVDEFAFGLDLLIGGLRVVAETPVSGG